MISRMGMSAASAVAMHTAVSGKSRFIVLLGKPEACPTLLTCLARPDPFGLSLAHNFNNDAFWAPAVEFGVINLLPRAEIELSIRHGHDHLVVDQQTFQVEVAIGFAGAVMAVIVLIGRQALEPFIRSEEHT